MKYNSNLYFMVSGSCQLTKGFRRTLIQDFSRKTLEYIPNDYYILTKTIDRHRLVDIEKIICEKSKSNFDKYLDFMLSKEYAFLTNDKNLFPKKIQDLYDAMYPINDAIIEFDQQTTNINMMKAYLKELNNMQCPYLQLRFVSKSNFCYIEDILRKLCALDFECVEVHVANCKASIKEWNTIIDKFPAVSRIYVYNQPESHVYAYNINPDGYEGLLMGEVIHIKHDLNIKNCGKISKYTMQFFNEKFFQISKLYNSCLYKKITIDSQGLVKNCPAISKTYNASFGLKNIIDSQEFQLYWSLRKDDIEVCKDCELRYNCLDCRVNTLDKTKEKPNSCKYNPYKKIWNDE